jgi:hypothetical protein
MLLWATLAFLLGVLPWLILWAVHVLKDEQEKIDEEFWSLVDKFDE